MSPVSAPDFEPGIAGLPPHLASLWGFRSGERGTHTSRTIMLDELSLLLAAVPGAAASRRDYAEAVLDGNCLGKRTAATRKLSLQRLTELYGLDTRLLLFRMLKGLWERHEAGRPLLALLLALGGGSGCAAQRPHRSRRRRQKARIDGPQAVRALDRRVVSGDVHGTGADSWDRADSRDLTRCLP